MRGFTAAESSVSVVADKHDAYVSGGITTEQPDDDFVYSVTSGATTDTGYRLRITPPPGDESNCSVSLDNESVAEYDADTGIISRIADGECSAYVSTRRGTTRTLLRFERSTSATHTELLRFASGSMLRAMCDAVSNAISGKTPATAKPLFTTMDHGNGVYVRNTGAWTNGLVDLSCCSPWNSYGGDGKATDPGSTTGQQRAGTLISSRHILFAQHYQLPAGTIIRFVRPDNTVVTRKVLATRFIVGDIYLGVLGSTGSVPQEGADVTGCSIANILPDDYLSYLPHDTMFMPVVGTDQQKRAILMVMYYGLYNQTMASPGYPTAPDWFAFTENIVGGDSGSGGFYPINGTPCIQTTWTGGGNVPITPASTAGGGGNIWYYREAINAGMAALDTENGFTPNKTLTAIDLSSFNYTNYGA